MIAEKLCPIDVYALRDKMKEHNARQSNARPKGTPDEERLELLRFQAAQAAISNCAELIRQNNELIYADLTARGILHQAPVANDHQPLAPNLPVR